MTNICRTWRMVRHVPLPQLLARLRFTALRAAYGLAPRYPLWRAGRAAAHAEARAPLPSLPLELRAPEGMAAAEARATVLAAGRVSFLGRALDMSEGMRWRDAEASPLWQFHLHYLSTVSDLVLGGRVDAARDVLTSWLTSYEHSWDAVAWHPYPVSLRLMNVLLAASHLGRLEALHPGLSRVVALHAAFLRRHLERDLRGNHLLENAVALLFAGRFLWGPLAADCERTAREILATEVAEQFLSDGAHFELSPMYHSIVMLRLLQVVALLGPCDALVRETLMPALARMARFLRGILCPDGDIPLLGDSVRGTAPPPTVLFAMAEGMGIATGDAPSDGLTSFADCGLHVFRSSRVWAVFDAGPVCAPYLPGHGQADSLTLEVWCDGACVVGDPGVHEYTGPERAWNRSSRAHSTLTVDDADTSEVYDSFRVGGRAQVTRITRDTGGVEACLRPFGADAVLIRQVRLDDAAHCLEILDAAEIGPGRTVRARLHLHPSVSIAGAGGGRRFVVAGPAGRVRIESRHPLRIERGRASRRFGEVEPTTILVQELRQTDRPGRVEGAFRIEPCDEEVTA